MEEALSVAAFIQAAMAMLWRLKTHSQRWRLYDRFLIEENRWRAQRYGSAGTLLDLGRRELRPLRDLLEELIEQMEAEAAALSCLPELRGTLDIVTNGTSADRQRRVYAAARDDGASGQDALRAVMRAVTAEFREGL
jgi:carboxylate-amine ligase